MRTVYCTLTRLDSVKNKVSDKQKIKRQCHEKFQAFLDYPPSQCLN
jgi:hypothetical protein